MIGEADEIRSPEEVDVAWLSSVLGRSLETPARVVAIEARSIGTGQVGENVRFELTWDADDGGLPHSVVGKFPSTSDVSRATAIEIGTYVKEVGFYRDLRNQVTIRTPRVHHIGWNSLTHEFVILMEDVAPATPGDQLGGCSPEQARDAIDEAVSLHASTWGTVVTAGLDWLVGPTDESVAFQLQLFDGLTAGFVDRYEERLSADDLALTELLTGRFVEWYERASAWADQYDAWCVTHGDYRLDNMLFGTPPASPRLTVVDWQTVGIGSGPADVAYFCGASMLPAVRARHERELVGRYAAGLRTAGVALSDDAAWEGYVLGCVTGLYMAVLASQIVERTDRGDEMFAVMAERHADQIRSVGLLDVLDTG